MDSKFEFPNEVEINWRDELVGKHIAIYWDGDQTYFPCTVVKYDGQRDKFHVFYESDQRKKYIENLRRTAWKIWKGSEEEYKQLYPPVVFEQTSEPMETEEEIIEENDPTTRMTTEVSNKNKSNKNPTYTVMIMEAVINLNEKEGSSLNAIRKYITSQYNIQKQQVASFNNLTLKAVNKAVACNELEKIKHSFRLTAAERERRKEFDKRMNATNEFDLKKMGFLSGSGRKFSPFVIDSLSLSGIAHVHNKSLRRELFESRNRRDLFLKKRLHLLKPFLPEVKDYFTRRALEEEHYKEQNAAQLAIKQSMMLTNRQYPPYPSATPAGNMMYPPQQQQQLLALSSTAATTEEEDDLAIVLQPTSEPIISNPANVIKIRDVTLLPTVTSTTVTTTNNNNEDIQPIDENKLFYSTLDGVEKLEPSPILTATLHEHQIIGISWMIHMFQNGMPMILGDQMGLGKTIQTIGFLAYLQTGLQKKGPHLIVVPLSVLSNWLSEIEKFCPSFRAVRLHGPKVERERVKAEELHDLSEFDIVVTTFEILVSEINFFRRKYVWTTVIIDEGHRLKNEKSQLSEKLRCVPCVSKVVLTGTPLQNNLHELWAIIYYLAPDIFSSSEPFDEGFDLLRGYIDNTILRKARKLLSIFMLRRLKENVAIQLPSKREITVLVSLTEQQIELYKLILCGLDTNTIEIVMKEGDINTNINTNNTTNSNNSTNSGIETSTTSLAMTTTITSTTTNTTTTTQNNDSDWRKLMNILMQLRKICNHTYLLPHIAPEPYEITEEIVYGSGKLLMLDRMLPKLRADGHRVLLFSQFTSMLDILEDYCELRDYTFVRLDGETNRVKRRLDCRRFNAANSNLFIFLISTRAGGLGLNLASADTVILYDSDWNPQVDLQAMERAHRIGQVKPVRVFRLICRGSVEERMISRAEKKLFLNAMVAEIDPDEQVTELHEEGTVAGATNTSSSSSNATNGQNMFESLGFGTGGSSMSKAEIASMIRFGANAIIESESNGSNVSSLSEEELDTLLERQGRDNTPIIPLPPVPLEITTIGQEAQQQQQQQVQAIEAPVTAVEPPPPATNTEEAVFVQAQAALKDRMEMLQEVDLRQLGNMLYTKKKSTSKIGGNGEDSLEILTKRQSKKRIVMVDGKGTGYGGAVPILADNLNDGNDLNYNDEEGHEHDTKDYRFRGRTWVHRNFCTLCGKCSTTISPLMKCAHCPFLFHQHCLIESNQYNTKGMGMFICSHHRCVDCNRSTASAGGLLFRCNGCLTAYCEDCLPQDEIESCGRCRDLEIYGYHSKQAYYIKCPSCCDLEGLKPTGVLGDQLPATTSTTTTTPAINTPSNGAVEGEDVEEQEEEEEEEPVIAEERIKLPTQYMRIQWSEILDPPPKPVRSKGNKKGGNNTTTTSSSSSKAKKRKSSVGGGGSAKKAKKTITTENNNEDEEEDDDEDDNEGEEEEEETNRKLIALGNGEILHPIVPCPCLLEEALAIFLTHPAYMELVEAYNTIQTIMNEEAAALAATLAAETTTAHHGVESSASKKTRSKPIVSLEQELAIIVNKVDAGRYRSVTQFVNDLLHIVEAIIIRMLYQQIKNKNEKLRIQYIGKVLLHFVKNDYEPFLVLTKPEEKEEEESE